MEVNIQFKMDSGAQANILPVSEIKSMIPQPELKQTSTKLTAYNGSNISVLGKFSTIVSVNTKKSVEVEFIVINGNSKPILGLNTCVTLVEKPNGRLRVCLDPRPLNKAIKRNNICYQQLRKSCQKWLVLLFFQN